MSFKAGFHRLTFMACILTGVSMASCEAHDYWLLTDSLTVDSEQEIYQTNNSEEISQDLFVRYQLDYTLENLSESRSTEVVVSATSYVNDYSRATGQKVWHLNPSETVNGMLMTNQLELGNKLVVSLQCCEVSSCTTKEVICPADDEYSEHPSIDEVARFCYDSCESIDSCLATCPAEVVCSDICAEDDTLCRTEICSEPFEQGSCDNICKHDEECISECHPAPECVSICNSLRAACFKNCLSTWNRCEDEVYVPKTDIIPCALCGGEGACKVNLDSSDAPMLESINGEQYTCDILCQQYSSECVTGCESLYEDSSERTDCLDMCLQQQLYWCNDYSIPVDHIDSKGKQPCCYNTYCYNALDGVVKSYDVECFNDTSCSSGKYCSSEGICVSEGSSSSCSAMPSLNFRHSTFPYGFMLLLSLCYIRRRKMMHETSLQRIDKQI